jgi:UDP:flavonoid glycosyltransferase YjiC (YdhE family)
MRVLLTTRGSSGHVGPLAPFGRACVEAGHEVLVSGQRQFQGNVERAGLPFTPVDEPPREQWMPLMGGFAQLDFAAANAQMIGDFFARLDTTAALPELQRIVEEWRPEIIVRESWEYAGALVAERHGIPLARVALGLAAVEEQTIAWAAASVDAARAELGLPPDPAGDRLRDIPYLTTMPAALEDPAVPMPPITHRFRPSAPAAPKPLPDWWPGNHDPLVYLTFGSVTAGAHLPYYPGLYRAAIDALAPLPVRLLITIGEPRELGELGELPPNVRVEQWVPQEAVAPHAAVIVCHGGRGSTLGALEYGVPLVVLPLFSFDQVANAEAVARAGAGVAMDGDRMSRGALEPPPAATVEALGAAVRRVLADGGSRREAQGIADATRELPPVEAAVEVLEGLARH